MRQERGNQLWQQMHADFLFYGTDRGGRRHVGAAVLSHASEIAPKVLLEQRREVRRCDQTVEPIQVSKVLAQVRQLWWRRHIPRVTHYLIVLFFFGE